MLGDTRGFENQITINGAEHALEACAWCNTHIPETNWGVSVEFGRPKYTFSFLRQTEASLFALKWI